MSTRDLELWEAELAGVVERVHGPPWWLIVLAAVPSVLLLLATGAVIGWLM